MTIINPKAITDTTIGEDLKAYEDYFFKAEALPNATAKTSDALRIGGSHAGLEIKTVADTAITIAATETLLVEIQTSTTESGTYTTVFSETITGAPTTIAVGDEVHTPWVPNVEGDLNNIMWAKVKITASADQSGAAVNSYIRMVRV